MGAIAFKSSGPGFVAGTRYCEAVWPRAGVRNGGLTLLRTRNYILPVLQSPILDCDEIVVRLSAGQSGKAAGIVVDSAGEDLVIGIRSVEEGYDPGPVLVAARKLGNVPSSRKVVSHVLEMPIPIGYASTPKGRVPHVTECVAGRRAVTRIDIELDPR